MRRFHLNRIVDETGISGTGVVAEGVQYSDGTIALRWCGRWPSSVAFYQGGVAAVEAVHGHGGQTAIEWLDPLGDLGPSRQAEPAPAAPSRHTPPTGDYIAPEPLLGVTPPA